MAETLTRPATHTQIIMAYRAVAQAGAMTAASYIYHRLIAGTQPPSHSVPLRAELEFATQVALDLGADRAAAHIRGLMS